MFEIIASDSVVDYLSLCFGINAALGFPQLRHFFTEKARKTKNKKSATLTIMLDENSDSRLCNAITAAQKYLEDTSAQFTVRLDKSYLRGKCYSFIGCAVCFTAILFSQYPIVKAGHVYNLLYASPLLIFVSDLWMVWLIWKLGLIIKTKDLESYRKQQKKLLKMEKKLGIPKVSSDNER